MPAQIEHKIIDGVECKRCSTCKGWLPLSEFSKDKTMWDGLHPQCKECNKQYRENNKEKAQQYRKQYYKNNKELIRQCQKQYRKNNKEKIKRCKKQYANQYHKQKHKVIQQKFGNKCYLCEKILFKRKRDFVLHHATYQAYKKYPGEPTRWSVPTLEQLDKEDFLLLCKSCHDAIHYFLNLQRWKRPCSVECVIEKLLKLRKNGKLNWHHGEKK